MFFSRPLISTFLERSRKTNLFQMMGCTVLYFFLFFQLFLLLFSVSFSIILNSFAFKYFIRSIHNTPDNHMIWFISNKTMNYASNSIKFEAFSTIESSFLCETIVFFLCVVWFRFISSFGTNTYSLLDFNVSTNYSIYNHIVPVRPWCAKLFLWEKKEIINH